MKEVSRYLGFGVTVVEPEKCIGCGVCATKCEFEGVHLAPRYDIQPSPNMGEYFQRMNDYSKSRIEKIEEKKMKGTV